MKSKRMLPPAWVDRIFSRLDGVYGGEFAGKFSRVVGGVDQGISAAKATWADELGGFVDAPEAIAWALDSRNLPDRAPNLIQFLAACKAAPKPRMAQLEHVPTAEEREQAQKRIESLGTSIKAGSSAKFTGWWQLILANPEKYPAISVQFAKEARKHHTGIDEEAAA